MKRFMFTALAALAITGMQAQTILSEDFETGNTGDAPTPVTVGTGWTVINGYSGETSKYNWHNYYSDPSSEYGSTIGGACCAEVEAPLFTSITDGKGPREEILLSPELNLDNTYQLQFSWQVSPMNRYDDSKYDIQVRVVTDGDLDAAETVFSIQNAQMLRESGVNVFPIESWDVYTSRIDLSDWKGEKVKLAFVYKMMAPIANLCRIDDISVKQFTPATTPVAALSMDRYTFPEMYIGEKYYSDQITLTNTGKDGLTISSIDFPAGVGSNLGDLSEVNLLKNQSVKFNLFYSASLTSAASGNVVIHTNGGDVTVAVQASKQFVPEGKTLETFETYSPPAGWATTGWGWGTSALEGDYSMLGSGDYSETVLVSPRLDLSDGGTLEFTYFNWFDSDDSDSAPTYDITVEVSHDGGLTWQNKWTSDYINGLNQKLTAEVDLGTGDDNSYVRWRYPAVESDDYGALPHSLFYLDRVLLPYVYGADGVPQPAKIAAPANNSTDIYPRDVKLQWTPGQFAQGYKLYVGTTKAANELIDGLDLGNELSYTIPELDYATEYRWKVVGYNDKGDCANPSVWRFTTQPDASVTEFPYEENFEGTAVPTGWTSVPSENYSREWYINSYYPYTNDGKSYNVLYTTWLNADDKNAVVTPEFSLPADKPMSISFLWGDAHPSDLKVDATGTVKKQNVEPNNGVSAIFFDVYADGEWTNLSMISENYGSDEKKFWINEKVDLAPYQGKKVQFRWRHESYSSKDNGASLTHILIDENRDHRASFNLSSWDAGKVNYEKAVNSGEIFTLLNDGEKELVVKATSFETPNFSTSLKAGDTITVEGNMAFSLQFDALQTETEVSDNLSIEFEGGYVATLPVSGQALRKGVYYYSFEPNELDYNWEDDFTMIDADEQRGPSFDTSTWIYYSADGQLAAFTAENDSKEHGMYGIMAPVSGLWALVAAAPSNGSGADNWIISRKLKATNASKFDFYARNWESLESVLPDPKSEITVLVSTDGNTETSEFQAVLARQEIPYQHMHEWNHYEVDLADYAGQEIYVALRHTTASTGNLAFFDDFTFTGFDDYESGIDGIAAIGRDSKVEVYTLGGVRVAAGAGMAPLAGLQKGIYLLRVSDENGTRTLKMVR